MSQTLTTFLIHHPYSPPQGFDAVPVGVFKASTIIFPDTASLNARAWKDKTGYTYGLHGTPTTFTLEERIATLEGGLRTLLTPSGLSAISLVNLGLLRQGDQFLLPSNVYGPGRELARGLLRAYGIDHALYDPMQPPEHPQSLRALISERTRLVWLEAAGSVTLEFPDVPALVRTCRERGVLCAIDNTWGAGLAFNPFDLDASSPNSLGVDLSIQALTKYASGGADVLMGSVTTRNDSLHQRLAVAHMQLGIGIGANDAELVLRSLPSIDLRYAAQDAAARTLAAWLKQQALVSEVFHPALDSSPGHAHWQALCSNRAAGLFSVTFDTACSAAQVNAFVDALRLFKIGYSWGGPVSLVVPYDLGVIRSSSPNAGMLVRFSAGLESVQNLQADLAQALQVLSSKTAA